MGFRSSSTTETQTEKKLFLSLVHTRSFAVPSSADPTGYYWWFTSCASYSRSGSVPLPPPLPLFFLCKRYFTAPCVLRSIYRLLYEAHKNGEIIQARLLGRCKKRRFTLLGPQSRFGGKSLGIIEVCPQIGTAVLEGFVMWERGQGYQ